MLDELKNNITKNIISADNFSTIIKDHIGKYWINSPDKDGVDLKLDIVGDETLTADCDVTDHYVESNIAYQDQITLKPQVYTISGEVGELVWYQKNPVSQTIGQVAQKLEGVISFLPIRSKGFNQMKKTVMKASQWVDTASNALTKLSSLVGLGGAMTRQAQAYQWLVVYRNLRMPLTIRTPWGILKDYVITNLEFKQPKETKDKSYITITFKEFRLTSIHTVPFDMDKYQGNAAFENQPLSSQGKTSGESVPFSQSVSKDDKIWEVLDSEVDGTAEKATIRVQVTDGEELYSLYWGTGNRFNDSRFIVLDSVGKRVTDNSLITPITKVSESELIKLVDKTTSGFVKGD